MDVEFQSPKSVISEKGKSESQPESDQDSRYYQLFAVLSVCYLCISCGTFLGYAATAVPSINNDTKFNYNLTDDDVSWIGSLGPMGAVCGSLLTTVAVHFLGIKSTLLFCAFPAFLASWLTISLSTTISLILVGRFAGGVGTGMTIASVPIYVVSIVDMGWRGKLGVAPQFLMLFGILTSYTIGAFTCWNVHSLACLFIALPSGILLYFAPHTPSWLLSKGRTLETLSVLERLHGKSRAGTEYLRLVNQRASVSASENSKKLLNDQTGATSTPSIWFQSEIVKPILLSLALMSFQQFCGINGVTFNAVTIFQESAGVGVWGPHTPTIILAGVQCISSFTSSLLIDRAGRKVLLLVSAVTTALASSAMGIYFYVVKQSEGHDHLFWLPLLILILFAFGFAIGLGPIAYLYNTEILPEEIRSVFNPIIIAYTWACTFAVTKSFPFLKSSVGIYGVFWVYASFSALAFIVMFLLFPETKGKTLDQVRAHFNKKYAISSSNNTSSKNGNV